MQQLEEHHQPSESEGPLTPASEFKLFGDSGFPATARCYPSWVVYNGDSQERKAVKNFMNDQIKHSRVAVEQAFGRLVQVFRKFDGSNMQLNKSPVHLLLQAGVMMQNFLVCFNGSPQQDWGMAIPEPEEYFTGILTC